MLDDTDDERAGLDEEREALRIRRDEQRDRLARALARLDELDRLRRSAEGIEPAEAPFISHGRFQPHRMQVRHQDALYGTFQLEPIQASQAAEE